MAAGTPGMEEGAGWRHKSSWVAAEVPRFQLRGTQALVSAGCREMAGKGGRDWSLAHQPFPEVPLLRRASSLVTSEDETAHGPWGLFLI